MKVKSIQPLFQYGIKAYKHETIEINDKRAKELIKLGVVTEVKSKK